MTRLGIRLAILCLIVLAPADAQTFQPGTTLPGFDAWPDEPSGWRWRTLAEAAQDAPADSAMRQYAEGIGADWYVLGHPWLGTPSLIVTTGIDLGAAPLDASDASVELLRAFVRRHRELLGVDRLEDMALHRVSLTPNAVGHSILGVDFRQTLRGFDVWTPTEPVRVKLRVDATLGRLSAMGSDWIAGLDCRIDPIPREAAIERAFEEVPLTMPGELALHGFHTYVLVSQVGEEGTERDVRLVHHVQVGRSDRTVTWSVLLDANTGATLRKHDERLFAPTDVVGTVAAGTLEDGPYGPFKVVPLRDLNVEVVGGGKATTDATGSFRIAHSGTAPVTVKGRFEGTWCRVENQYGSDTFFSLPATPGTPLHVVMNPMYAYEFMTAEATAYRMVTETRYLIAKRIPRFNALWSLPTRVNSSSGGACTAWYNSGTINFSLSKQWLGWNCANYAYEEVIGHEYGHAFHVWFHGSANLPRTFSEGIASHLGLYLSEQRIVGRDAHGKGNHLEDYTLPVSIPPGAKDRQYGDPRCAGSYYCYAQAWVGFTMDIRDALIAKYGVVQGKDVAETVTIAPYDRAPASEIQAIGEILIQDDDDSNLTNGTPNFKQLAMAADLHGFPRPPDPHSVNVEHTRLADTRDTVNPPIVTAKLTSTGGTVNAGWVVYRVGTGPRTSLALVPGTGSQWSVAIPAQPAVSHLGYWIFAKDDKGHLGRLPELDEFTFTVGQRKTAFQDDFEADRGWTAQHTSWSGGFERADPIAFSLTQGTTTLAVQPEDDHTPGAGTYCWVTQNGLRSQSTEPDIYDVDHGYTEIRSPPIDLSAVAAGNARVRYARWFFTYHHREDALETDLSVDGGKTWRDVDLLQGTDNRWVADEAVLPGAYTASTQVRFRTEDDPNDSVTDACIDDVEVLFFDEDVAELRGSSATPGIGTTVRFTLDAAKRPGGVFAFAVSLSAGPTPLPGIGTLDLGLPFWVLWTGILDPGGKASFGIPIPNAPALRGVKMSTEAMVAIRDAILSNPWTIAIR